MRKIFISIVVCLCFFMKAESQIVGLEAAFVAQQMNGDHSFFENDDGTTTKMELKDFMVYGMEAGLNLGKFNMGMDFLFGGSEVISDNNFDAKITCVDIDFEYSFLNKSISPLLVGGIGSVMYTDSFTSVENLSETDFSYNAGIGVKLIISKMIYIKPLYRITRSKIQGTTEPMTYNGISIGVGYLLIPKSYR